MCNYTVETDYSSVPYSSLSSAAKWYDFAVSRQVNNDPLVTRVKLVRKYLNDVGAFKIDTLMDSGCTYCTATEQCEECLTKPKGNDVNTLLTTFRPLEAQIKQAKLAYDVASQDLIDYSGTDPEACEHLDAIVFNTYYAWKASVESFNKAYYALDQ